jgi:hypothetical protein
MDTGYEAACCPRDDHGVLCCIDEYESAHSKREDGEGEKEDTTIPCSYATSSKIIYQIQLT